MKLPVKRYCAGIVKLEYCLCSHKQEVHAGGWRCSKCKCVKFEIDDLKY
jgi:hypothetical protein